MTVQELIEQLQKRKPDARVFLHVFECDGSDEEWTGDLEHVGNDMFNVVYLQGPLSDDDADEMASADIAEELEDK
jgi:hypothetical protein